MIDKPSQEFSQQKIDRNSVHLQDFPDVSFFDEQQALIREMDLVREICSTALAIRDNKNLRVRLPLRCLTVIGKEAAKILPFADIIADEVNVKNIETKEDFSDFAQLKLQINFKKIGAKYGPQVKEIMAALKNGNWRKISENEVEIAGLKLEGDEFELKLEIANQSEKLGILALPSNSFLVMLDLELSADLINEGIARDLVRSIQQNRKEAQLDVSDEISLQIFSQNADLIAAIRSFEAYIAKQVLAKTIKILNEPPLAKFCFEVVIAASEIVQTEHSSDSQQLIVGFDV